MKRGAEATETGSDRKRVKIEVDGDVSNDVYDAICTLNQGDFVTHLDLESHLLHMPLEALSKEVNRLLRQGSITVFQGRKGLCYKAVDVESVAKFQGLDSHDWLVYRAIENEGNKGISHRDLKRKCSFSNTRLQTALRTLESRCIIKTLKSARARNRKLYMKYDIEPCEMVQGNPLWGPDNDFDFEYTKNVQQVLTMFIRTKKHVQLSELETLLSSSGVFKELPRKQDILACLQALIYKGEVKEMRSLDSIFYCINPAKVSTQSLPSQPCFSCPVRPVCQPGSHISPEKCVYFQEYF